MDDLNKKILVNYRLPAGLKEKLDTMARKQGKSATSFVQQVLKNAVSTDPEFWETLMNLAQVHQNIIKTYQDIIKTYKDKDRKENERPLQDVQS